MVMWSRTHNISEVCLQRLESFEIIPFHMANIQLGWLFNFVFELIPLSFAA